MPFDPAAQSPVTFIAPVLPVADLNRALAFYEALGFTGYVHDEYAVLSRQHSHIHLAVESTCEAKSCGAYLYPPPGTLQALQSEFLAAGIPIRSALAAGPWQMNEFTVCDPDGNVLRFGEPVRPD